MKKKYQMLFITILISAITYAQESFVKQSVYFELLGNGILYSFNYEKYVKPNISLRTGISVIPEQKTISGKKETLNSYLLPMMANYLIGKDCHKLELGAGVVCHYMLKTFKYNKISNKSGCNFYPTARFGYTFIPKSNGLTYKISYTPILDEHINHWVGISFGYSF